MAKQAPPSRKPPARRRPSLARRALRFVSLVATGSAAVLAAPSILRRFVAGRPVESPEMVGGGRGYPALTAEQIDISVAPVETASPWQVPEVGALVAGVLPVAGEPQPSRPPSSALNCPYRRLTGCDDQACDWHRQFIAQLLDCEIEPARDACNGVECCRYVVLDRAPFAEAAS